MTRQGGPTINQGGGSWTAKKADHATPDQAAREFDVTGNVAEKGGKPSPGDRERGETSGADAASPVDKAAHDRAS